MASKGYEYTGHVSVTMTGRTCQSWNTRAVCCFMLFSYLICMDHFNRDIAINVDSHTDRQALGNSYIRMLKR